MASLSLKTEDLPSNANKNILCKNINIPTLEQSTAHVNGYEDCEKPVERFYSTFKTNHDTLKEKCNNEKGPKCCRDVNYYIDLVTGIIKASKLDDSDKSKLIKKVETEWEPNIRANNIYTCERETDLDSTRKRGIIQHLYDLKEDETFILSLPQEYKDYLSKKWKNIISYTDLQPSSLFIKIENNSMGIIENYNHFLGSSDYICYNNLDKLNEEEITFSRDFDSFVNFISLDRIPPNGDKHICYNKRYVDMLKHKALNIQKINNLLFIGVALLGFSLILIFLYDYSPLGSWFRRCTKKKIEVEENSSEEFPELYENSENIERYITYPSMSH
ncbi:PIR Superfamily Protein [Plasmodium ovale wallikeri]|uniref:PIR Superfamily Protein n=2 Tax=Plasmodium ovale TaxID=36330 RepID=A0A1A9AJ54_PLAOA|nr:PIR Superfamily Protein [Plasmodium ovale wallikeri]SBT58688.1 PIR Superfamily Protein [Plasmodium ovale wallikeri]SBT73493.1 PIR protein [Plasmodium ovale]